MFDVESLNREQLEQLRDACNRRLLEMRRTQGLTLAELLRLFEEVKTTLSDQGKEWHSLERWQWMEGEIRFWLNPSDQENYRTGWFSIDELIAWSQERGPVIAVEEPVDDEDLWSEADGIAITWLPKGRSGDSVKGHNEPPVRLSENR